jgi:hypothetical protein
MPTPDPVDPAEETLTEPVDVPETDLVEVKADEPPEPVAAAAPDWWSVVETEFADAPITGDVPGVSDKITAETLKGLDPTARTLLRMALGKTSEVKARLAAEAKAATDKLTADFAARETKLAADRKALALESTRLRAMATSPEMRKLLDTPVDKLPDPMTAEGQQARIDKAVAERFRPFAEDAAKAEREANWIAFKDENPWANDAALQTEAMALIKARPEGTLNAFDAMRIAHADRLAKAAEQRKAVETSRRTESARHIQRTVTPAGPAAPPIPAGLKGPELYAFFERNPAARLAYEAKRRGASP